MILSSTQTLTAKLAGTVATTQLQVVTAFADDTGSNMTAQPSQAIATNDATSVVIVPSPASTVLRQLKYLSALNIDTAAVVVSIGLDATIIASASLAAGERLQYTQQDGFAVYGASGAIKLDAPTSVPSTTTASLTSAADPINTVGKFAGRSVWNSTTSAPVWAAGSAATAHWYSAIGVDTFTPV